MQQPVIPRERMEELLANTSKENPEYQDVEALRDALQQMPEFVEIGGNLSVICKDLILSTIRINQASRQLIEVDLETRRNNLGYQSGTLLEKIVIDQIMLCHLRLYIWEYGYHQFAGQSTDKDELQHWESLVNAAQKRYFRAIEMLVRVRRLGIQIQVNIATDGGQQVNIGEVSTKKRTNNHGG